MTGTIYGTGLPKGTKVKKGLGTADLDQLMHDILTL